MELASAAWCSENAGVLWRQWMHLNFMHSLTSEAPGCTDVRKHSNAWQRGRLVLNIDARPIQKHAVSCPDMSLVLARVHKNKSRQLHTMGSVTAEFEVRHRWRTTTLFSGRYALNAEHVHARSLQKLHLFDWHFRLGLQFACTCSSKYSVQRWVQRPRINVFPFLVQTDVGSDDELRILPWQHS